MAADILGVYPDVGQMDVIRERPHLPLSLIHAFSFVAQEFEVEIIDLRLTREWRRELDRALRGRPLLVALSVFSGRPVASAAEVSRFVKERSSAPVLWGGIHPTICPAETLADEAVDMVAVGEGEYTLLETARRLADGRSLKGVKGLLFKDKGEIAGGDRREPLDLDKTPVPPYHLVDVGKYRQNYRGHRTLNIETSRGCVHHCRYCYHTCYDGLAGFRAQSAEKTLDRLFQLRDELDVEGFYIVDDNFFLDKERGLDIARGLANNGAKLYWQVQGVDVPSMLGFSDAELRLLERSRLDRVSVGAESGSDRVLRYVKKPHRAKQVVEANRRWSRFGVNIFYSFVSGFPGETPQDLRQTIQMMFRLLAENKHARVSPIYNFLPYPNTSLWKEVIEKHGFEPPAALSDWDNYDWDHVNVPYLSGEMRRLLNNLYWPSLCIDDKFSDYDLPWWLFAATRLYRPLARARLKNLYAGAPFEKLVADRISSLIESKRKSGPLTWTL